MKINIHSVDAYRSDSACYLRSYLIMNPAVFLYAFRRIRKFEGLNKSLHIFFLCSWTDITVVICKINKKNCKPISVVLKIR